MRLILSALSYCSRPYVADPKKHDDDGDDDGDEGDDDDDDDDDEDDDDDDDDYSNEKMKTANLPYI